MHRDLDQARNGSVPPFLMFDEGRSANADFYAAKIKQLEQAGVEHNDEKLMKMTALFNKCEAVQQAALAYFDVKEIVYENELGTILHLGHRTVQAAMKNACKDLWKKTQIPLHLALDTMSAYYSRHFRKGVYKGVFKKMLNKLKLQLQGDSKETVPVTFSGKNLPKSKKRHHDQVEISSESEGPATKKKTSSKTAKPPAKRDKKTKKPPKAAQKKNTPRAPPKALKFVVGQLVAVGIDSTGNVYGRGSILGHNTGLHEEHTAWELDHISLVNGQGTHRCCAALCERVHTLAERIRLPSDAVWSQEHDGSDADCPEPVRDKNKRCRCSTSRLCLDHTYILMSR
jgi:hypothetical protein